MSENSSRLKLNATSLALGGFLVAGLLGIVFILYQTNSGRIPPDLTAGEQYRGTDYDPPVLVNDFTLTSHTGEPIRFSDLRGRFVLLFFGFTHCPDVCPTTLAQFRRVKSLLDERADNVAFVFISVDGERDTPEVIAQYIGNFDTEFIGMTGTESEVRSVGADFGLQVERRSDTNLQGGYSVDHTSRSYLLDREGRLRITFAYGTEAEVIAQRIEALLRQ